jgi:hypothetical protein
VTGRTTAVIAAAALTVALVATLVRPFLPHPPDPTSGSAAIASTLPAAAVGDVAERTATRDLRCPTDRPRVGCGTLLVLRRQATCSMASRCRVDLIGEIATERLTVPIAITVTVTRTAAGWHAVEVHS